jgi:hypothetical protein
MVVMNEHDERAMDFERARLAELRERSRAAAAGKPTRTTTRRWRSGYSTSAAAPGASAGRNTRICCPCLGRSAAAG